MAKLRARLTYANVVSSACLFVLLGGTSYAVATGSIGSREIKDNAIQGKDLLNGGVRGKDLARNTITGRELAEGKLTSVPRADRATLADRATAADQATVAGSAATLAGRGPDAFAQGGGRVLAGAIDVPDDGNTSAHVLLEIPGFGRMVVDEGSQDCLTARPTPGGGGGGSAGLQLRYINTTDSPQQYFLFDQPDSGSSATAQILGAGAGYRLLLTDTNLSTSTVRVRRADGRIAVVSVVAANGPNDTAVGAFCRVAAQGFTNG